MNNENEKLVKSKEVIDQSTNDAKTLLQKLKLELETQEEEIRDKESRIHRLEFLSLVYRLSKFFGGILIGVGIFIVILVLLGFAGILNFSEMEVLLFLVLIIAGVFSALRLDLLLFDLYHDIHSQDRSLTSWSSCQSVYTVSHASNGPVWPVLL